MIMQVLPGPHCQGSNIIRHGTTRQGTQRYRCQETAGKGRTVLLAYTYAGHAAGVKQPIIAMAMNASGMRATARVLHVSPTTVIKALQKKEPAWQPVHHAVLTVLHPKQVEVDIWRSDERAVRRGLSSELDAMWSVVQAKAPPRWLWHAIDHHPGQVCASVCGRRQAAVFLKRQELLEPFGITQYSTDGWGAYERHIDTEQHHVGQENTQKIERKHLNLRTRIKR